MTTMTAPASAVGRTKGSGFGHLLKAEYLKIRTTNVWWLLGMFVVLATGLALLVNILNFHFAAQQGTSDGEPFDLVAGAATIYTSGQFFGAMLALVLAILTITNEYHHQTVTTTFLATPHRTAVVMAKFIVAMVAAAIFWAISTVLDIITGLIYFPADGYDTYLGNSKVVEAMFLSLAVYGLWAVFGVGLGVLIRSQIGATLTGTLLYVVGTYLAIGIFQLVYHFLIKKDWVLTSMVIVPGVAAQVAITPTQVYPHAPDQWVGAAVMIGYALVFGAIGIYYMRKRDVS